MTRSELQQAVAEYASGLQAQAQILRRISSLATDQREASLPSNLTALAALGHEREALTASVLALEAGIRPARTLVERAGREAEACERFAEASALRQAVSALVSDIASADRVTMDRLRGTMNAEREAAHAVAAAERTLDAYRRAMHPLVRERHGVTRSA